MQHISAEIAGWALLILGQVYLLKNGAAPSAYRHVLCGILHRFGGSDLHCADGS